MSEPLTYVPIIQGLRNEISLLRAEKVELLMACERTLKWLEVMDSREKLNVDPAIVNLLRGAIENTK